MKRFLVMFVLLMCLPVVAMASGLPEVGKEAPDFEIELLNGEIFRLSEQRGKVVLINIWASWCGPCVAEMPDIDQLAKDYADDLVVIGVNCSEDEQTVADFVAAAGYSYNFAVDPEYYISGYLYPSRGIPYSIVVDANGMITQLHTGGGAGMYEVLEGYVLDAMTRYERPVKTTDQGIELLA